MSISDSTALGEPEARSQKLRAELKAWEKTFADANEGRKAGREDIKKHPDIGILGPPQSESIVSSLFIAQLYKEYSKLRVRLESSNPFIQNSSSSSPATKKRKRPSSVVETLSTTVNPLNCRKQHHSVRPADLDPYDSPQIVQSQVTPSHERTIVGPTPQKNGLVLGLFDFLSPTPTKSTSTPSKQPQLSAVPIHSSQLRATPSKSRTLSTTPHKHSRTPQSISKRNYLSTFLTPSTRRINAQHTPVSRHNVSVLPFEETPQFLRRDSQRSLFPMAATKNQAGTPIHEEISFSPVAVRLPPKPIGRGLSVLVKNLRSLEDELLDEDLDVLREMEAEQAGVPSFTQAQFQPPKRPKLLVQDSQLEMPLGADGEKESSEDEELAEERLGKDAKPLKVWKKKGQKRRTRRVIMKPTTAKWQPEKAWGLGEGELDEVVGVKETQHEEIAAIQEEKLESEHDETVEDAEMCVDDHETLEEAKKEHSQNSKVKPKGKELKKISATANPNFRALKIKNKQSKGKRGTRFSRKR